jgi:hypothetical protein
MKIINYFIVVVLSIFTFTKSMAGENYPVVFTCKTPKHLIIIDTGHGTHLETLA